MEIKLVSHDDKEFLESIDPHMTDEGFENLVYSKSGYIFWAEGRRVGLIEHSILWDEIPFMDLLHVKAEFRDKGYASHAILNWEAEMKRQGYKMTMISTQSDETAQNLYRKLGYVDCGCLVFNGTPCDQPLELFFRKVL